MLRFCTVTSVLRTLTSQDKYRLYERQQERIIEVYALSYYTKSLSVFQGGVCNHSQERTLSGLSKIMRALEIQDRPGRVRVRGSVAPIKEKSLVSCGEVTSPGRQSREGIAQASVMQE